MNVKYLTSIHESDIRDSTAFSYIRLIYDLDVKINKTITFQILSRYDTLHCNSHGHMVINSTFIKLLTIMMVEKI